MKDDGVRQLVEICKQCDEFFKDALDRAIKSQQARLSDTAAFYLLSILLMGLRVDPHFNPETIVKRYTRVFTYKGPESFRDIGDTSLMMAGIWWESLARKLVDVDYYIAIGRLSYKKEAVSSIAFSELFEELAEKFVISANILTEATHSISANKRNVDILRMYEFWLRTHNPVIEQRLRELGIDPVNTGKIRH